MWIRQLNWAEDRPLNLVGRETRRQQIGLQPSATYFCALPTGKPTKNYGRSTMLSMGKSTISTGPAMGKLQPLPPTLGDNFTRKHGPILGASEPVKWHGSAKPIRNVDHFPKAFHCFFMVFHGFSMGFSTSLLVFFSYGYLDQVTWMWKLAFPENTFSCNLVIFHSNVTGC